jgi:hypothetical protein
MFESQEIGRIVDALNMNRCRNEKNKKKENKRDPLMVF